MDLKNLKIFENIGFYLGTDTNDTLCGIIRFIPNYRKYCDYMNNVFSSFKFRGIVNSNEWIIKYTSKDEGLLIFNPEMDKLYKNYDVNKLFIITNSEKEFTPNFWTIMIDKVFSKNVNGSIIKNPQEAQINNDFGLLEGSGDYYYKITQIYFKEYFKKKICNLNEIKVGILYYFAIECHKTNFGVEELKKFPTLSLQLDCFKTEFTFDYKDLFTENKYKYFFNIIFNVYITDRWVLGKPFLRKYPNVN